MKLPSENPKTFIMNIRESMMGSQKQRAKDAQNFDSLYYAGATIDKDRPAIANIIYSRINTQAGNLFSPDRLSFRIEYDLSMDDEATLLKAKNASSYLSRELREADADLEFGDGVLLSLRHGWAGGQLIWDSNSFQCNIMSGATFCVMNENANNLYEQPGFMVTYTLPESEFEYLARKFKPRSTSVSDAFDKDSQSAQQMNEATRVVLGLNQPISSGSSSQAGFINLIPRPPYIPSPNSIARHVTVDAIWLHRDDGRWATVYVIDGNETIGTDQWRNFMAIDEHGNENKRLAKRHPYFGICPFPVKGTFFGRSEIANLVEPQGFIRRKIADMDHILDMQADPSHIGYGATQTSDIYKQNLRTPGGWVQETGPNAKVTPMAPEMPQNLIPAIELASSWAAEAASTPPVVQGRGEQGVRAQGHAETLMMAASSPQRRPALRVVRQCGDMGDLALDVLRAKDAISLPGGDGTDFVLESLVDGFHVYCNGFTASPLFAAEHRGVAEELLKAGAIGPEEFLDMINPEGIDTLQAALKKREMQQQKLIQSLPPEDRLKLISGGGHKKR